MIFLTFFFFLGLAVRRTAPSLLHTCIRTPLVDRLSSSSSSSIACVSTPIILWFLMHCIGAQVATDPNNNNTTVEAAMTTTTRHDLAVTGGGGSSLCVRMASPEAYDGVVALKDEDGSGPLLFWSRKGKIWAPEVRDKPLIDLGGRLSQSQDADARGLAGVAVHHSTGRVFLSYYSASPNGSSAASLVVDELSSPSGWKNEVSTYF